ncbi:MAG: SUMF1/EgtB/PvdO family nonheme iron enzyme [Chloroflexota bacterium]
MALQTGQLLNNRYRIERLLGQGGFGAVYLAWDHNLDEHVAVKESLDTSPAAERQFRNEARLLFKLHHPNLPRVHDCFSIPNRGLYLVMDYIEGESLERKLASANGPLPAQPVLGWIGQVCDALEYLHRQSPPIIHRDIKPANIILRSDGCPFLVDFGISKVFDPQLKTTIGARAYTPGFSPPEQYGSAATDERSDIYSLGATVYHLLTGQVPPASMDISSGVAQPPAPPQAFNPGVTPGAGTAVLRAMQLNRDRRWSSAGEFKRALLGGVPVQARPAAVPATIDLNPYSPPAAVRTQVVEPAPVRASSGGRLDSRWRRMAYIAAGLGVLALLWVALQLGLPAGPGIPTEAPAVALATAAPTPTVPPSPTVDPALFPPAGAQSGAAWIRPADGMTMIYIPAGEFLMGSGVNGEKPPHTVYLDAYWIDRTEVTNAMYQIFVDATGYQTLAEKEGSSWAFDVSAGGWKYTPGANWRHPRGPGSSLEGLGDHPVVQVAWDDALAYCKWAGGSLPTEAQWEKAARGTDGRRYPWNGSQPASCEYAVMSDGEFGCGRSTAWPVGSKPAGASPYGVMDMAGNVFEWVLDWFSQTYYQISPASNPSGPVSGEYRVIRGGSWDSDSGGVPTTRRPGFSPTNQIDSGGFRCAR